jgi:hypothetical protein
LTLAVAGAVCAALVPAATAQAPVVRAYGGQGGSVQQQVQAPSDSLPFTGQDLALVIAAGVLLVLVGTMLWRLTTQKR